MAVLSGFTALEAPPLHVALLAVGLLAILWVSFTWFKQSHIPGPFIASVTNIPRSIWAISGKCHDIHIGLHEKYGDVVRLGPNCISIGDPREIQKIYGNTTNFGKSDFYKVLQPMAKGHIMQGLVNTQDNNLHRAMKRPIAGIYSMSNLVEFEPYVDTTIEFFCRRLEEVQATAPGQACDLGTWLQWFAFDVIGEITFSKRLGFLDAGRDVDGIMESIGSFFDYVSSVAQMPWVENLWFKNPYINRLLPVKSNAVVAFAAGRIRQRTGAGGGKSDASEYNSRDFLSRFLEVRVKDPSIPEWYVTAWTTSNVLAGSDTTAILLRSLVYFLVKNGTTFYHYAPSDLYPSISHIWSGANTAQPSSLEKLMTELSQARREGRLSDIVTWKESRELPYFDACVKEAGRLHPAVGVPMERIVPKGGAEICGKFFGEGTIVAMSPWVVHRKKEVFGDDAGRWNPDRWLSDDKERRVQMERCLLTFGTGPRTCLGKNISYLEIYKLIPTLFAKYNMTLAQEHQEWIVVNRWLAAQKGLMVNLQNRDETA